MSQSAHSHSLSLKEQLFALVQVQEVDVKMDQLRGKVAAHAAALKVFEDQAKVVQSKVALKDQEIADLDRRRKQVQGAKELNEDRLKRADGKASAAAAPREAQAAQREQDQLKAAEQAFTADLAKLNMEIEALRGSVKVFQEEIAGIFAKRDTLIQEQAQERNEVQNSVTELTALRASKLPGIGPATLGWYDRIRVARGGVGIAPAIAGRCKGCNMMVPPQMFNELAKYREQTCCPSCSRILYVPA